MSVADVARMLRLSVKQIEAIEAEDYVRLPGRTFVRGFIRNYARLVQLDPDHVVALAGFNGDADSVPRHIEAPSQQIRFSDHGGRPWLKLLLAVLVAVAVASWAVLEWLGPEQLPKVRVAASTTSAPDAESSAVPGAPPHAAETTPEAEAVAMVPAPAVTPAVAPPPSPVAIPVSPTPAAAAVQPVIAMARVTMNFSGAAWVEVRDKNGKKLHSQLDPAGSQQTIEGEPPLSLVIGSAPKVTLTYKGAPIDLAPYTKADVARLTLE